MQLEPERFCTVCAEGTPEPSCLSVSPALQRQPVGTAFFSLLLPPWARVDGPFTMNCDPAGTPRWTCVPRPGPDSLGEWVLSWGLGVGKVRLPGRFLSVLCTLSVTQVLAGCELWNERPP